MEFEGNGEGGSCVGESGDIAGVFGDIGADVGAAGGGDIAGDAIAVGLGEQFDFHGFGGKADADDEFEFVGFSVEEADGEVIEVHQLAAEVDDAFFEELEALADVKLGDGFAFETDEFVTGLVDGIDFLLKAAAGGGIPADGDNLRDAAGGVDDGRAEELEILRVVETEREFSGAAVGGNDWQGREERAGRCFRLGHRADLIDERIPCLVADGADTVTDGFGPLFHPAIGPKNLAMLIGNADTFADGIEDEAGLLGSDRAFEGEEIGGV